MRQAARQPALGLLAGEEQPSEDQRLGIGEEVVAEQVPFDLLRQPADLHGEAVAPVRLSSCSPASAHLIQLTMRSETG